MAILSQSVAFPVVFFNGVKEKHVGLIFVNPTTELRTFKSHLRDLVQIDPHFFSVFLLIGKKLNTWPDNRIKTLLTDGSDFASIIRLKTDCTFSVVVNRVKPKRIVSSWEYEGRLSMENVILLRRGEEFEYERLVNGAIDPTGVGEFVCPECMVAEQAGIPAEPHMCCYDDRFETGWIDY